MWGLAALHDQKPHPVPEDMLGDREAELLCENGGHCGVIREKQERDHDDQRCENSPHSSLSPPVGRTSDLQCSTLMVRIRRRQTTTSGPEAFGNAFPPSHVGSVPSSRTGIAR